MTWGIDLLLFAALASAAGTAWLTTCAIGLSGVPAMLVATVLWAGMWWLGNFLAN